MFRHPRSSPLFPTPPLFHSFAPPPVFVSALGSVIWAIAWRGLFATPSGAQLALYMFLGFFGLALLVGGHIFSLIVMGGASRNLVSHLLWNEPVLARTTYAAVRSRFWSLLGAAIIMMLWIGISASVGLFGWYMVISILVLVSVFLGQWASIWLAAFIGVVSSLAATAVALCFFFFMAGKVAYVPQVMLVEGK